MRRRPRADPLGPCRARGRALGGAHDRAVRGPARGRRGEPADALGRRALARGAPPRPPVRRRRGASTPRESGGRDGVQQRRVLHPAQRLARAAVHRFRRPRTSSGRGGWWPRAGGGLRARRGRVPLPSRGPARPGAAPDRHQSRGVGAGTARAPGAGRSARRPGSSTGTPARSSASTSRSAASSRTWSSWPASSRTTSSTSRASGTTAERRRARLLTQEAGAPRRSAAPRRWRSRSACTTRSSGQRGARRAAAAAA